MAVKDSQRSVLPWRWCYVVLLQCACPRLPRSCAADPENWGKFTPGTGRVAPSTMCISWDLGLLWVCLVLLCSVLCLFFVVVFSVNHIIYS